jgi:poly-gamma-glutamate synthesis protein (capsule biosynthesis protein)
VEESADSQATQTASVPESKSAKIVSLGFTGDICLADNYIPMQTLTEKGSTSIYDGIDARFIKEMRAVDLMWVNNEFAYGTDVEPLEGKEWTFLANPENVKYLKNMGVDIVGLANNHVFDYGEEAFLTTLDTLNKAGIPYVGAGRNSVEANAPVVLETRGVKVAYVAASCAEYTVYTPEAGEDTPGIMWCYDDENMLASIRQAAAEADYVVALPHWGVEHSTELEAKQIESARAYLDAGADAVVGGHSHILQGIDFYDGKPILYNLGNFWFDGYDIDTVLAELVVNMESGDAQVDVVLVPGTQSGAFTASANSESERDRIFRYIESISPGAIAIDEKGRVTSASA